MYMPLPMLSDDSLIRGSFAHLFRSDEDFDSLELSDDEMTPTASEITEEELSVGGATASTSRTATDREDVVSDSGLARSTVAVVQRRGRNDNTSNSSVFPSTSSNT